MQFLVELRQAQNLVDPIGGAGGFRQVGERVGGNQRTLQMAKRQAIGVRFVGVDEQLHREGFRLALHEVLRAVGRNVLVLTHE